MLWFFPKNIQAYSIYTHFTVFILVSQTALFTFFGEEIIHPM